MRQATIDARPADWPEAPVDAAAFFYSTIAPQVRAALAGEGEASETPDKVGAPSAALVLFPPADHAQPWRLAAIQALAREATPRRVNGVVGDDDRAVRALADWLAEAEAITGQLLEVAGNAGGQG